MKKILNIFASITLVASSSAGVVSCSSSQKTGTDQSLYNQLQGKTFTIQDNKFWGNEANYQQDLLKDIEKSANISSQDDKLLSDDDVTPFLKNGEHDNIQIVIAHTLIAHLNINWQLTSEQSPLYNFYQQWPLISQKIGNTNNKTNISLENGDLKLGILDWWGEKSSSQEKDLLKNGWDQNKVNNCSKLKLNGSILKLMLENIINNGALDVTGNSYFDVIKQYLVVPNLSMNLGQNYQLKLNDLMMKNGNASFPLNYIGQDNNEAEISQPWTIDYSNTYYSVQNQLKNEFTKDSPLLEAKSTLKPPYKVTWDGNRYNNKDIDSQIGYTDHSLRNIIGDLTFEGDLSAPKEKFASTLHPLEVYYKGIDQGFKIYVSVENI